MPQFKNTTNETLTLPDIGIVGPGQVITAPEGFNNANFTRVGKAEKPAPADLQESV